MSSIKRQNVLANLAVLLLRRLGGSAHVSMEEIRSLLAPVGDVLIEADTPDGVRVYLTPARDGVMTVFEEGGVA